jgi:hypothetical protein
VVVRRRPVAIHVRSAPSPCTPVFVLNLMVAMSPR